MTSQLNVDTIVDKAGSGGVGIKIGNDATSIYESEKDVPSILKYAQCLAKL